MEARPQRVDKQEAQERLLMQKLDQLLLLSLARRSQRLASSTKWEMAKFASGSHKTLTPSRQ